MAFALANFHRIGTQNRNAPSLWTLTDTGSTLAQIDGSGYLNTVAAKVLVGDLVYAKASNGYGLFVVATNTRDLTASPPVKGVVDLSNAVALGAINSD